MDGQVSRLRKPLGINRYPTWLALTTCWVILISAPASASLGENADSIASDAKAFRALTVSERRSAFSINTMTLPSSIFVKEYVGSSGQVFAVSWRGIRPPDLSQLLGSYYQELQSAQSGQSWKVERGHERLNTGRMMFESVGHMRDIRGNAYIPSLMPSGVTLGDLK